MKRLACAVLWLAGCTASLGRIGDDPAVGGGGGVGGTMAPGGSGGAPTEPAAPVGPPPVRCDRPFVGTRTLVRLTAQELANTLRDIFPEAKDAFTLDIADPLDSKDGFVDPAKLLVGEDSAEKLLTAAKAIGSLVAAPANLATRFPCAAGAPDAACVGEVVLRYGRRLFRRPLTAEEQQRYVQLATGIGAKTDFAQGVKWALVGLVQSPSTLYRPSVGSRPPAACTGSRSGSWRASWPTPSPAPLRPRSCWPRPSAGRWGRRRR